MYQIKLFNKISAVGTSRLDPAKYACGEDLDNYDAILVRSAKLHDTAFPKACRCIARAGAGVNNIPLDRCAEEGIVVFNTPGANSNAVKELVICGLLLASRKVVQGAQWVQSLAGSPDIGPAAEKGKAAYAGPELMGKTLGVIGLGAIGWKVANAAEALGMKVLGYDPYLSDASRAALSPSVTVTTLDDVFAQADYITVHVPLLDSTRSLICADSLSKMKDGVRIVNFARGELVDTPAMADALASGKAAAYVCDFASDEILAQPNAVVLPHLGASTPESEDNCAIMACDEVSDFLENGNIVNSVNFPAVSLGQRGGSPRVLVLAKAGTDIAALLQKQGVSVSAKSEGSRGNYCAFLADVDQVLPSLDGDGILSVRTL
ncbi:MAG: 3-phosphoglycerate dehydrogenase [Clostridiaceae bacterium]|nr:3-phosphoglycerate dehydrogenase [Clostridiaceae bacterium]